MSISRIQLYEKEIENNFNQCQLGLELSKQILDETNPDGKGKHLSEAERDEKLDLLFQYVKNAKQLLAENRRLKDLVETLKQYD